MPACPTGTLQQQVMQQYSYLFQMVQQLNLALEQLEQTGSSVRPAYATAAGAAGGTRQAEADRQYQKLRTMIIKTADQVRRTTEELTARLEESKTDPEGGAADREELLRLRETLRAERERACALESRLRQQSGAWETAGGDGHLWALCAKMERTLSQMERMLDGPYRMTCYPEPAVQRPEPVDPETFSRDGEAAPAGVSSEPDASAVSGLLRKIRKK